MSKETLAPLDCEFEIPHKPSFDSAWLLPPMSVLQEKAAHTSLGGAVWEAKYPYRAIERSSRLRRARRRL